MKILKELEEFDEWYDNQVEAEKEELYEYVDVLKAAIIDLKFELIEKQNEIEKLRSQNET